MINIGRRTIGLALAAAVVASAPSASAQQRSSRIEGQRYSVLRSLAGYVENGAEFTLEEAQVAVGTSRNSRERNLLTALRNFHQQARTFRDRIDQYEARPWRFDTELTRLRNAARTVNTQLGRVPALSRVTADWNMVVQDINDMTRIANGEEIVLRRATERWERRTEGSRAGFGETLRGQRLEEFRRLARQLDTNARQAYNRARNQRADYSGAGVQLLRDLETFAQEAARVRADADAREIRPRDINATVARLLEDARRADTSMRNARVYSTVWNEWTDVIRGLEQMMPLVRSEGRRDDSRDYGRDDSNFGEPLRGQRLDDFRRLARELDVAAREAYNRARNQRADYSGAGVQLLRDLETFAQEAARVRADADAREIRPRDINPTIARLLEDARRADTSMRNARVYSTVWNEWTDVIRRLEQMMPLVR